MRVVAITGNHPRHNYLVRQLESQGILAGWVAEIRESFVPEPPDGLPPETASLFRDHFHKREQAEALIFGDPQPAKIPTLQTSRDELNSGQAIEFIRGRSPDLVLSYGCHKLSAELRAAVGCTFWNTHGGLSPEYRGVITHFWPSYMLEPQMTGVTLHETTDELDGGGIIHQTGAALCRGDGVHELAARTVKKYADEIPSLISKLDGQTIPPAVPQRSTGKLWLDRDWRPEHLHFIYEIWQDRIVDAVLDGLIQGRTPKLRSILLD